LSGDTQPDGTDREHHCEFRLSPSKLEHEPAGLLSRRMRRCSALWVARSAAVAAAVIVGSACTSSRSSTPPTTLAPVVAATSGPPDSHAPTSPSNIATVASASAVTTTPPIPSAASVGGAVGLAGDWTGTYASTKYPSTTGTFHATFVVTGVKISGTVEISTACVPQGTLSGVLSGATINFGAVTGAETVKFTGTISGSQMKGTYTSGPTCGNDNGTWNAQH